MGQRQKKSFGHMCSADVVGQQDDDDWRTVDVEQERQTLACSSPLGTAVLFGTDIRTSEHQVCK